MKATYEGSYAERWFVVVLEDGTVLQRRLYDPEHVECGE